ncbi:hypothetical protein CAPTEDRAFT_131614 [Capitella teleta]|uniref:Major facilitator superfamily (MFS) profile domain-containing protein n=1 Tax=Capitella teleta TaxID=283909 RepID=R7UKN9_CAPTE|nr:hypothetical protein CAPTEDRAFT_131614 [Capitella teleta]|eukprot:ELU03842.1 hypothetical protein CAPTEDRAFT_131614 [Capitella teleta]
MGQTVRDGGWGWCVTCCSLLVHLVVGGFAFSGGVYYLKLIEKFEKDEFESAWTGSLLMGMTVIGGIFSTLLVSKIGYRVTVILGGVLAGSGMAVSIFCTELWHTYLCIGVLSGIGCGLALTPSVLILDSYFYEKREIAASLAVSGMSVGMMIFPLAAYHLENVLDWKGFALTFAGLCLNICIGGIFMRNQDKPGNSHDVAWKRRHRALLKIFETSLLKSFGFHCLLWANFFWCFGMSIFFNHLPAYAMHIGATEENAVVLIGIMALSTLTSRATFQLFSMSAKLDHISNILCTAGIATILTGLFPDFFNHRTGQIGFAIMLGMHSGYWSTFMSAISEELIGPEFVAYGRGFTSLSIGLGFILGAPSASVLLIEGQDYDYAMYMAGEYN